jgi:coenzyme F420-reducing hydrogenase alpha subunit
MSDGVRTFKVDVLARVEGEGSFRLEVKDGEVVDARLSIFESPRYFEALLRGRSMEEVSDIVSRICGICPVAYQMSSARALERAIGLEVSPEIWALRRLLYCGEWIESHALHVFLLHAPDYLGYDSAMHMAADHAEIVERGLRIKRAGNGLVECLGGRAVHPVSPCIGGFYRAPSPQQLRALKAGLEAALGEAEDAVAWTASLHAPSADNDYVFVSLVGDAYPLERGDTIAITGRAPIGVDEFEAVFEESHVEHSNALQCHLVDGTPYLTGPMARLAHCHDKLHPRAQAALAATGLHVPVRNPYRSIVVRAVEIVHALAEAIDLIDAYVAPDPPRVPHSPRAGEGCGATEAPRGICWHRYRVDAEGTVQDARIVPPTSQNQARIELDLRELGPTLLALDHDAATRRCEQLIRAYDPCISCATHFLRLDIEHLTGDEP